MQFCAPTITSQQVRVTADRYAGWHEPFGPCHCTLILIEPGVNTLLESDPRSVGIAVPNIYAGFMALGALLLDTGRQQVSIAPRSWMNGTYFSHFRRTLLTSFGIDAIHTFQSRSEVFGNLGVLTGCRGGQVDELRQMHTCRPRHDGFNRTRGGVPIP
ncbi:Eco57I restriction-modification methylase domain-containing protein [Actinomyces timonensis]|uniref:Eco57I restriction-modification methylase domain-containing protein n=1 Tax=Actinomyces timonensis TaxID=1288391 RepID=A0AAU8N2A8_9ACTO